MYSRPPLYASVSLAVAAGTAQVTVVPNPAPGFAIRLVGGQIGCNRAATAVVDVELRNGPGGAPLVRAWGLTGGGANLTVPFTIPAPGIQLDETQQLVLASISTVVAGTVFAMVYYYIDVASP